MTTLELVLLVLLLGVITSWMIVSKRNVRQAMTAVKSPELQDPSQPESVMVLHAFEPSGRSANPKIISLENELVELEAKRDLKLLTPSQYDAKESEIIGKIVDISMRDVDYMLLQRHTSGSKE